MRRYLGRGLKSARRRTIRPVRCTRDACGPRARQSLSPHRPGALAVMSQEALGKSFAAGRPRRA